MHSYKAVAALLVFAGVSAAAEFRGAVALENTRKLVALGQRTSGSPAIKQAQAIIIAQLKRLKCEVKEVPFTAQTPIGPIAMKNIIATFRGSSGRNIVFSGHYDTKVFKEFRFVGANDGGSSAGFLLELASALNGMPRKDNVILIWLDGEEAIVNWTRTDSLYGSRHQAQLWASDGTTTRIKALINVDMIGDKNLAILNEYNSTSWLRELVWATARDRGYGKYFLTDPAATEDDHIPFIERGVAALDLIDFDYGPSNGWWHTEKDTMDKLSANSFQVVGNVLMEVLSKLEKR